MSKSFKEIISWSFGITSFVFTFVPESAFSVIKYCYCWPDYANITISHALFFALTTLIAWPVVVYCRNQRKSISIEGQNYKIVVEYADIFDKTDCKKVISFDECYTTEVGEAPHQIKPNSLCGKFLTKFPNLDVQSLIVETGLTPWRSSSAYNHTTRYESGSVIPHNDYLLLAFAKLNQQGLGVMTREDYLSCLTKLWEEIDMYYCQKDVAIPVLGAGITRFNGESLTQQQLVDMIIASYQLSPRKIKNPNKLHIICREDSDFSLDKVGGAM